MNSHVSEASTTFQVKEAIPKDNKTPIVVVIPSLTSDSKSADSAVKYLGEESINSTIAGAAAVCSPWDPLISMYLGHRMRLLLTLARKKFSQHYKCHYFPIHFLYACTFRLQ